MILESGLQTYVYHGNYSYECIFVGLECAPGKICRINLFHVGIWVEFKYGLTQFNWKIKVVYKDGM
jgi:hypothetical protein